MILLEPTDLFYVACAYTALSVLCLTDLNCARMANESEKHKRVPINEKNVFNKIGRYELWGSEKHRREILNFNLCIKLKFQTEISFKIM